MDLVIILSTHFIPYVHIKNWPQSWKILHKRCSRCSCLWNQQSYVFYLGSKREEKNYSYPCASLFALQAMQCNVTHISPTVSFKVWAIFFCLHASIIKPGILVLYLSMIYWVLFVFKWLDILNIVMACLDPLVSVINCFNPKIFVYSPQYYFKISSGCVDICESWGYTDKEFKSVFSE